MTQVTGNGTAVTGLGGAAGYGETALARTDDGTARLDATALFESGFVIAGTTYSAADLYLRTDGILSFGAAVDGLSANPANLLVPFIAPFFADIDTRLDGEGPESGPVWVDMDNVQDVLTITWQDVGYYRRNATVTNTFQMQIFNQGNGSFDVVLRYEDIDWVSGDLEGGWGGLGGRAAYAGLRMDDGGTPTTLAASGNETALLNLPQTLGNTGVPGLWVYHFGPAVPPVSGDGPDTVTGGIGNDTLRGLGGNDVLLGGAGADELDGGTGFDTADYSTAASGVIADLTTPGRNTGEALADRYIAIEAVIGSAWADDLGGDAAANRLEGGAGNDTLTGRAGNDTLTGGAGDDRLDGGAGADLLTGGGGYDWASYASAGAAIRLDLATPAQNQGDAVGDVLTEIEAVEGSAFADGLAGDALANRMDGGAGNDTLSGRAGADTLSGGTGNDVLDGGAGGDALNGGEGQDTATYASATLGLRVDLLSSGQNSGDAAGDILTSIEALTGSGFHDTLLGDDGGNAIDGGAGNDAIWGRNGGDTLAGGAGDDTLEGGSGADAISGGDGVDWASYAAATTGVRLDLLALTQNSGDAAGDTFAGIEGFLGSSGHDTLSGDDTANRLDGGAGNDALAGRGGNDSLTGGSGDDTLQGGAGADVLNGGDGTDWASYALSTAAIRFNLAKLSTNTGEAMGDTYVSIEGVTGSGFNDTLAGDAAANRLDGGGGDDSLAGLAGNDSLFGGAGKDTLGGGDGNDTLLGGSGADLINGDAGLDWASYATAASGVLVDRDAGTLNSGDALGDKFTGIEAIAGSNFNDDLRGSKLVDTLDGGAGNDTLLGRGGNDVLLGGGGNDTLDGGIGADMLDGGEGFDWVRYASATKGLLIDRLAPTKNTGDAAGDTYINIEAFIGSSYNDTMTGNDSVDRLDGGPGNDRITGRGGDDTLTGGVGNDTLAGDAGNDRLSGGAGADSFVHAGGTLDGTDWVTDYAASQGDVLAFTGAGALRGQFRVDFLETSGEGRAGIAEAFVVHVPSGRQVFAVTDGAALTDLILRIGTTNYDLIG